jgi:hypothetical protein
LYPSIPTAFEHELRTLVVLRAALWAVTVSALTSALRGGVVSQWHRHGVTPQRFRAPRARHLSIGRLQGLLVRSATGRSTTMDRVVVAGRANSADNSVLVAPRDSVPRKHQRW